MIDYSKRKFAIYIRAKKPLCTYQLMFSENPSRDAAIQEVLCEFDNYFPTAKDREVAVVLPYSVYEKQVEIASTLNYEMST